jgi:hypothetical protein
MADGAVAARTRTAADADSVEVAAGDAAARTRTFADAVNAPDAAAVAVARTRTFAAAVNVPDAAAATAARTRTTAAAVNVPDAVFVEDARTRTFADAVSVPAAARAAEPETVDVPGLRLTVQVTTFAVLKAFVDVHTGGVTTVPDALLIARPSSAPATIEPPEPVAAVVESARSVYPVGGVHPDVPFEERSLANVVTAAFATPVVTLGFACVVPATVSARDAILSIGVVLSTPR